MYHWAGGAQQSPEPGLLSRLTGPNTEDAFKSALTQDRHINTESNNVIIARKADGNPEGKGRNGLLHDWYRSTPRGVVAKPPRQVLAELFTSMLVLSASFKFRPAVGVPHYLYCINDAWSLSLIAPEEWSQERRSGFVGTCVLQRDMTWTMTPARHLADNLPIRNALGRFYDAFAETLDTDLTLEEILPFCVSSLPYYQRLYASALSRSVRGTVTLGNQALNSGREWSGMLPRREGLLLALTA